jgi:hypothetical protein
VIGHDNDYTSLSFFKPMVNFNRYYISSFPTESLSNVMLSHEYVEIYSALLDAFKRQ